MKWSDVPVDALLIDLTSPSLDGVASLNITAFDSETDALDHRVSAATPRLRLAPLGARVLKKADLDALDPAKHPWMLLWLSLDGAREPGMFARRNHWALITWSATHDAFHLLLRSWGLNGFNCGVAIPAIHFLPPLALFADGAAPMNPERVFVVGDGGSAGHDYRRQVRTYVLMREFADTPTWTATGEHLPNLAETPDTPAAPRHHDGCIVTLVENRAPYERVSYTRLLPPFEAGPLSAEGEKRAWGQWYPVYRVTRGDDPIDGDRNALTRAYAYMRWVGANAPRRVQEFVVVSHAYVRSPLNLGGDFNHNRPEVDFAGDLTPVLDAFADASTFWVTGCNVDGGGSQLYEPHDRRLVAAQAIANVEGTTRAFRRLTAGVGAVRWILSLGDEAAAKTLAARVFGPYEKHSSFAGWQLPGDDEGSLKALDADYSRRPGTVIASDRTFATNADLIARWGAGDHKVTSDDARGALEWISTNVTWAWVRDRPMALTVSELRSDGLTNPCDYTVGEWIDGAREVLSASVHYVAAFAHHARARAGIRAYGGVPGMDGQHLSVEITARFTRDGQERAVVIPGSGQVTAYRRAADYQKSVLPWMLLFYRRFGFGTDHPLWYLDYAGSHLTASGEVAAEFDRERLDPWPPPWLPPL
ncbi:MAG: hypothetical protein U0326_34020 [Polyangiales bacterium]